MNFPMLSRNLGLFFLMFGIFMAPPVVVAVAYFEFHLIPVFLAAMGISAMLGGLLWRLGRDASGRMYAREALAMVGLGWLVGAALGGIPFWLGGMVAHPADAYFESMSGFTTTGASVLSDIESQAKSLLFWRSFTHWLGGMGIIVLFVSILPYIGAGGKQLFKNESPGPDPRGLVPKIRDTASILWKIYLGLTLAEVLVLRVLGMNWFDSFCHTFGTLATGGFSTRNASIAAYASWPIEFTILVFMVLAGTNFSLYFQLRSDRKALVKDPEWRLYVGILLAATAAVTADVWLSGLSGFVQALRDASFSVVSVMTTTGYGTADFDRWPAFSHAVLLVLMFIGGSAGSTGGGLKVIRLLMLWKIGVERLRKAFSPRSVRSIRIGSETVSPELQSNVTIFFFLWISVFTLGTLAMTALGMDFVSGFSAVAATLNNIGPGFASVGPTANYGDLPAAAKMLLSLFMVIGRVEMIAILVLFVPDFWRKS